MAPKTRKPSVPGRPIALARAEHGEAPLRLDAAERTVLNDALRLGEDLRENIEATITSYGRWLLSALFNNDANEALDAKTKNKVWLELIRRAGGPTLAVSRRLLYVALTVAAHDKRITDQAWRGLDSGRKELLLPLRNDDLLREGAQHVTKFKLTQASTREYVSEVLKASGGRRRTVRMTAPAILARMKGFRAIVEKPALTKRLIELRKEMEPAERAKMADEIDELKAVLTGLSRTLRRVR